MDRPSKLLVHLLLPCMLASIAWCEESSDSSVRPKPKPIRSTQELFEVTYSVPYAEHEELDSRGSPTGKTRSLLADIYLPKRKGPKREGPKRERVKREGQPESLQPKNGHPTLLMVHGGAWFSGNKAHVSLHARNAAESGYAVVAINYRLAPKYKFPAQVEDLRAGLGFIRDHAEEYNFDTHRIAAYGYSAGAHLVSLLGVLQNESDENRVEGAKVRAVVAGGTPCEFSWIAEDSERLSFWLGGSRKDRPETYRNASPVSFVNRGDPPMFIFHGSKDFIVPIESSKKLHGLLVEQGVKTEYRTVPKANHLGAFVDAKSRTAAIEFLDTEFFDSELGKD